MAKAATPVDDQPQSSAAAGAGAAPPPDDFLQLRVAYAQMKSFNLVTMVFLVIGFCLFALMYQKYIAPDVILALKDLSTLGMVVFPFIPALVLSFFAKRQEKKYLALLTKYTANQQQG
jgi:Na+/proline symporter